MTVPMCPTCRVAMDDGFIVDHGHLNSPTQAEWTGGPPTRSWYGGLKLKNRIHLPVTTYRCPACGLLQSYARDKDA
jgi:hypothetical protein